MAVSTLVSCEVSQAESIAFAAVPKATWSRCYKIEVRLELRVLQLLHL